MLMKFIAMVLIFSLLSMVMWLMTLISVILGICCVLLMLIFIVLKLWCSLYGKSLLPHLVSSSNSDKQSITVGFFHPYCNAGGGGERVLWTAIKSIQTKYCNVHCIVFTGDKNVSGSDILNKARQRFGILLPLPVDFVFLRSRVFVEASTYPIATLLGQSLGSVVLGFEALLKFVPDIYIDTMGYAFTLPIFHYVGGCCTGCYVHYPTISEDMLSKVSDRRVEHNNSKLVSSSSILTTIKIGYYRLFAAAYSLAGRTSDVVLVNSSWTHHHIVALWNIPNKTHIVYPPCDTTVFEEMKLIKSELKVKTYNCSIISVAQFRPEKNHVLQIKAFNKFLFDSSDHNIKLLLVGSCRNVEDELRVEELRRLSRELGLEKHVEFKLNVSFEELTKLLSTSTIGLHTMWNEHFGIGIVECMAAGTIVLAHKSGGPLMDIVTEYDGEKTGFLADSVDTYVDCMKEIFKLSFEEQDKIRFAARKSSKRFSVGVFENEFISSIEPLFHSFNPVHK